MEALRTHLAATGLAAAVVGGVVLGARHQGATWPAALGLSLALGLGVLLSVQNRTPATPAEVGRGLVVGGLIALMIGWIQLDNDVSVRQAENRRQDATERRDLQLLLARQTNLTGIPLNDRDLSEFFLSGKDLARARLRGARLQGTDLRGARLTGADLLFADMQRADLSPAGAVDIVVEGTKRGSALGSLPLDIPKSIVRLLESGATEEQLREAVRRYLATAPIVAEGATDLRGAVLRWADLRGADLRWARFDPDERSDPTGASTGRTDLTYADLRGAKLNGATLEGASLDYADLRTTALGASPETKSTTRSAPVRCLPCEAAPAPLGHERELRRRRAQRIAPSHAVELDEYQIAPIFVGASLEGARLDGADLREGDFREADLSRAVLRGADLRRVDLRLASLRGADLREANMQNARLAGAIWDRSTKWPRRFPAYRRTQTHAGQTASRRGIPLQSPSAPSSSRHGRIRRSPTRFDRR